MSVTVPSPAPSAAPAVDPPAPPIRVADIGRTWWPLAVSWLLMSAEGPGLAAVAARLKDPEIHLAAWGGVVFPVALLVEAPIIMMLAASTALSRDRESYRNLLGFTTRFGFWLTLLHAALAFSPLFDLCVVPVLNCPPEVVEPARQGLRWMLPWTWAIADRRFHQGVLIRSGRSRAVGVGSMIRLTATASALLVGYWMRGPGVVVASAALSFGVVVEMVVARRAARGAIAELPRTGASVLSRIELWRFYLPLALTPFLVLSMQPIGSAAIGRMPLPLSSLAIWPVLHGLVFLTRSPGLAFNEVAVRHSGDAAGRAALWRFAWALAAGTTAALALAVFTPLGGLWFGRWMGLDPELAQRGARIVPVALAMPALTVLQCFYQGLFTEAQRTRPVTEAVALNLGLTSVLLAVAVKLQTVGGLEAVLVAFTLGNAAQTAWLWWRARQLRLFHRNSAAKEYAK